ncbi:MAG: Na+/H+ antiporter [Vampirovibrio sp.]|nr:Na+/H+ antiporter [Vampirovibrio sp.]
MITEPSADSLNIELLVLLVAIASLVAMAVKRIRLPYTIALVIVGLLLSTIHALPPVVLTEDILLFIFLPALLFEAAWHLDIRHLRQTAPAIAILAVVGVLLSTSIIGGLLHVFLGLDWLVAFLFGAMISATDPVSVVAIMKQMRLDHRLSATLEGESLFNDGTAVVLFKILLALLLMGSTLSVESWAGFTLGAAVQFLVVVSGGALVGGTLGFFFSVLTSRYEDHLLELTFTVVAAYGAFLIAENISVPGAVPHLHLSGVIATVTAGLVMGNYGRHTGMSATTRISVDSFWEFAAFLVNSLIFLMLGLEIHINELLGHWQPIGIAVLVVLFARSVAVYGLVPLVRKLLPQPIPIAWRHVMVWGGLRGALSMALALSLPTSMGDLRILIISVVFGVVLVSLLGQALTIPALLKKLNLGHQLTEEMAKYHTLRAKLLSARDALASLKQMEAAGELLPKVAEEIKGNLNEEVTGLETAIHQLHLTNQELEDEERQDVMSRLWTVRKNRLSELVSHGVIAPELGESIKVGLDESLDSLNQHS